MEKVFESQEELTGYITGKVKGGFIATVDGLPCFMPSSQIDIRPLKKVDHLMNIPVKVIATRIDKNRGNVCVSRRAVLEKSKNAEITEALKNTSLLLVVGFLVTLCGWRLRTECLGELCFTEWLGDFDFSPFYIKHWSSEVSHCGDDSEQKKNYKLSE